MSFSQITLNFSLIEPSSSGLASYTAPVVTIEAKSGQICQGDDYKDPGNTYSIGKSFKEDGSEASFMIEPLHKRLEEIVKQQKEEAKELGREFKPVATIICDHEIPYRIISEVVYTIGMAGLSDLRFAVFKGGKR